MPDLTTHATTSVAAHSTAIGHALQSFNLPTFDSPALPAEDALPRPHSQPSSDATSSNSGSSNPLEEVDPQIIEALKSKDRLYVLKLGELMEGLINDQRPRLDLTPSTSYQRLLVHRCSAFYKLAPESETGSKGIVVLFVAESSRIPPRRLADLVPPESVAQPAFQIMRRNAPSHRNKPHSQAGSVAGEDADLSDVEASEAGSIGGRSSAASGRKKHMTIEEREAAYNEARSRIFMGFQGQEKDSSSSTSLTSGSTGTSNSGDMDDSASIATESERSASSYSRDRKDVRRNGSGPSSSRSLRSSAPAFTSNGHRNSRAPSPSSQYGSLYDPTNTGQYDNPPHGMPLHGGYPAGQYMYPYAPPGPPGFNPNYYQYPTYPTYNSPPADGVSTMPGDMYPPQHIPPHAVGYSQYPWPPAPQHYPQQPLQMLSPNSQHPLQQPSLPQPPGHHQHPPQMYHNGHSPMYAYPMTGYYTPQHVPNPQGGHAAFEGPTALPAFYIAGEQHSNSHVGLPTGDGHLPQQYDNRGGMNGEHPHSRVHSAPAIPRHAWSYGPGISGASAGPATPAGGRYNQGTEVVGPRFSNVRRLSNNSGGNRPSSYNDEVSSTASSSTTSSSSRRTFTSTSSSQHPLPARPDWAVGLKADPVLHSSRQGHSPRERTPSHNGSNGNNASSTDFPPLSTAPEKVTRSSPAVGAWTNSTSTRSILMPPPNANGSTLVFPQNTPSRDEERGFDRPPPIRTELFNPKSASQTKRLHPADVASNTSTSRQGIAQEAEQARAKVASVVEQMRGLSVSAAGEQPGPLRPEMDALPIAT